MSKPSTSPRAELRERISALLVIDPAMSNRAAARATGASHPTVASVRAELILAGRIKRALPPSGMAKQGTTGKTANLLRQTRDGPPLAATHRAYSARALAPRVEQLTDELREVVPGAESADDTVIRLLALLLAQIEAANVWVAERGLFRRAGRGVPTGTPQPILTMQARWITAAAKLCDQLGLTPSSRVRLGVVEAGADAYADYLRITQQKEQA